MKNFTHAFVSLSITAILSISLSLFPQAVHALEITIEPNGTIYYFNDGVLGKSTESLLAQTEAVKVIPPRGGNRMQLRPQGNSVNVGLERVQDGTVQEVDKSEAQRLRVQFPAQVTEVHMQNLRADDKLENKTEYQQRLLEERKDRTDNVEVRSKLDNDGSQELEVRSKSATARIRQAEFAVEPETNRVTITTPSGQERELNHLPDQALERIRQRIRLQNTNAETPDFSIENNDQGQVIYRTRGTKQKKFLGLFDRGVEAEVILNDETGEVTEQEIPSPGVLGQFLDVFTL